MKEIEVKAKYDAAAVRELQIYLESNGYGGGESYRQTDWYYNHPARDFFVTDEALRLRSVCLQDTGKTSALITYKGKNQSGYGQSREELECRVADVETMTALLDRLGFILTATVSKERRTYRKDRQSFCLDTVEGLGTFFEIEILCGDGEEADAREALKTEMASVAFVHPVVETTTYLEQIIRRGKMRNG